MSQYSLQFDFYASFAKPINHYNNARDKALSGFVIGALNLSNCCLIFDVDCSYGNIALFPYVNNEVGEGNGHNNSV